MIFCSLSKFLSHVCFSLINALLFLLSYFIWRKISPWFGISLLFLCFCVFSCFLQSCLLLLISFTFLSICKLRLSLLFSPSTFFTVTWNIGAIFMEAPFVITFFPVPGAGLLACRISAFYTIYHIYDNMEFFV